MLDDAFDIDGLAAFLHLAPAQVARLADRGKLPGRKVGGQWRFAAAEIHHWLEDRIGLSDEQELVQVEGVLDRASPAEEEAPRIADLLPVEAIAVPLEARTRNSVISEMVDVAARTGWLWDPAKMVEAVRVREEMHPTALENGVALMHPRRPMANVLGQAFLAFGRTAAGIPFGGSRGTLTDLFFLILSIEDRGHLRVLARLSRLINDADFLAELRGAPDAAAAHETFRRREEQFPRTLP
jgi:PTS system nitrogen regulatory IIA component